MGIQDKLNSASIAIQRKLTDNQIRLMGRESRVFRIKTTTDEYGDTTDEIILSTDYITIYIDDQGIELPIYRDTDSRNQFDDEVSTNGVYLFEIIPIDAWAKWEDNVEKGDYVFNVFRDETGKQSYILYKVANILGRISTHLNYKKIELAPYNGSRSDELIGLLEESLAKGEITDFTNF